MSRHHFWLWPDKTITKEQARKLRQEHNEAVNDLEQLLAACEMALVQISQDNRDRDVPEHLCGTEDQIRAAIAKAKGQS